MLTTGTSYAHSAPVLLLKDIDPKGRTVQFYGSAFGNVDSDGDVVVKGAFAKTILEAGPLGAKRIKHLRQHQTQQLIGRFTELKEDEKGLLCTSILADSTEGNDALALYELDLFEHSIGYGVIKQQYDQGTGINTLTELRLREVSSVTWGANGDTPLVGIKCDTKAGFEQSLARLEDREAKLVKALRHGTISDNLGHQLADELEALQTAYKGMISLYGQPLEPTESRPLVLDTADRLKAKEPDVPKAKEWLQKAIALHEKHMDGSVEPTDASQKTMMTQMKSALTALGGSMAPMKATSEAPEPSGEKALKSFYSLV
ncbi:HK97 family phage prohead protease [Hymenobacter psychrophilus]|uniref:Phage prohead protease, HK97 family n=1 Tax=Hymenobacter psychrophilus TaxID=651662 RepID=A0A1H3P9E8_9BACT|nr:HK97 family phage prohead protease [Hymenobacter psychrophilus]SDY97708.1 phage prohead protease, HK97 family [Hymenobacter psychrophilus]